MTYFVASSLMAFLLAVQMQTEERLLKVLGGGSSGGNSSQQVPRTVLSESTYGGPGVQVSHMEDTSLV